MHETNPIISVEGVYAGYGNLEVLCDVRCQFDKNRITAIMGPSGCGKSTLLKSVNRTLELTPEASISGVIRYHGEDIYAKDQDLMSLRKNIGIIDQRPLIFPMSIIENVLFGAKFHRQMNGMPAREYAEMYLDQVGLLEEVIDRLEEPAIRLSGGQQQRLCLARSLANQPDVIMMDEPCSSIDPTATQLIEEVIQELKERYTIVIVTHNMSQAKRVSDKAIFMFAGQIIEAGDADQIFRNPKTELADQFVNGIIG